jgi:hypothetical protein
LLRRKIVAPSFFILGRSNLQDEEKTGIQLHEIRLRLRIIVEAVTVVVELEVVRKHRHPALDVVGIKGVEDRGIRAIVSNSSPEVALFFFAVACSVS